MKKYRPAPPGPRQLKPADVTNFVHVFEYERGRSVKADRDAKFVAEARKASKEYDAQFRRIRNARGEVTVVLRTPEAQAAWSQPPKPGPVVSYVGDPPRTTEQTVEELRDQVERLVVRLEALLANSTRKTK